MALILKRAPDGSLENILDRAASLIHAGGALAYPTETFYGLGVDALNEAAVERLFAIKGRGFNRPVSVIIGHTDQLAGLVGAISEAAQKLMDAFWPGPLTIVLAAADGIPARLTAGTGRIGVRLSSHEFARRLALATGKPITATSANLSGAPECRDAQAVQDQIGDRIDAVVDLDEKGGSVGSTIVDATGPRLVILRPGLVFREAIERETGLGAE
ncbi:MAG: L-threonylcarbamoyladenylate synthase [Smithellaceae bacterium]|nr:threonylcarbamoyl-AMP synthase [Syntrophaceae bacterium]MDD4240362.1 L-threonylcarbamoyladenylate synthase [Smithellaceae bacterium]NLX52133.1 threonylcarbamoyl-AMP synthase [Deltaproteobacteria bacterium]